MKRKALYLCESEDKKRRIYFDADNAEEIKNYLTQDKRHRKKWEFIKGIILNGLRNPEVFDKENINNHCKDVYAMKFFKGQENDRIYCKLLKDGDLNKLIIVASELHLKKKTQENSKKEITIIEKVASYEYEFE